MTEQELEMCISQYGKDIYSFCKYLTGDSQEADDLYQDTFLKVVELKEKIDYEQNPKSYLLSIALRIWKNRRRKLAWRKRIADIQPIIDEKDVDTSGPAVLSLEEKLVREEIRDSVRIAVNSLPVKLKIVVLLFYMEDLSTTQVAEILKIPPGTVLSRLHQARKVLRKDLEDVLDGKSIR